ncbi:MAG: ECF transporter S component [Tyzzerella sp.]|nr:ECF transporter S component [Tyzzerella sp.]
MKTQQKTKFGVREIATIGMLAAVSIVLTLIGRISIVPPVYDLDFSEVPVLIGTFAMGPLAGVAIEAIKAFVDFLMGSHTGGVGEFAQFVMGCSLCVPAGLIYKRKKTKSTAIVALGVSVIILIIVACIMNRYVMLPLFWGSDMQANVIAMGLRGIDSVTKFILLVCAPFNLLKGGLNALIVASIYKKISPIIKRH